MHHKKLLPLFLAAVMMSSTVTPAMAVENSVAVSETEAINGEDSEIASEAETAAETTEEEKAVVNETDGADKEEAVAENNTSDGAFGEEIEVDKAVVENEAEEDNIGDTPSSVSEDASSEQEEAEDTEGTEEAEDTERTGDVEGSEEGRTEESIESASETNVENAAIEEPAPEQEMDKEAKEASSKSGNCGANGDNLKWSLSDDGTLTITGKGEMHDWNHEDFWGYSDLVPWNDYKSQIKRVVIGEGVTSIGFWAFADTAITSATLPSTIKDLSQGAFAYCSNLKKVTLNKGLEYIGYSVFKGDSLSSLTIPGTVTDIDPSLFSQIGVDHLKFESTSGFAVVNGAVLKDNGKQLIYAPTNQSGTFTVPATVETIGFRAFEHSSWTKVILPSGLRTIESSAFQYASITSITIPESVETIENSVFYGSMLKKIVIPEKVKFLGSVLFCDCYNLEEAEIDCGLDVAEDSLFYRCGALKKVTLKGKTTKIPEETFAGCEKLENFKIPSTVKSIEYLAFGHCEALTDIELPEGLETIGEAAFYNTGIKEITIPSSVSSIGKNAFPEDTVVHRNNVTYQKGDGTSVTPDEASMVGLDVTYGQTEARKLLSLINDFRKPANAWQYDQNGKKVYLKKLDSLTYDYDLEQSAMQRAAEIAVRFDHTRTDGTDCSTVIPDDMAAYGENIASGYSDHKSVFTGWQETNEGFGGQGHRRNMLSENFNCIGIGHVVYNGRHYWVQEFGYRDDINTTKTKADDSQQTVNILVENQYFGSNAATASPGSYLIDVNESAAAPKAKLSSALAAAGYHFDTAALYPVWTSADTSIAKIENGKVIGVSKGVTYLTGKVLGKAQKVTVVVGKLATPKLTGLTNISSGVTVSWNKVPGAVKYRVLRKKGSGGWSSIGLTTDNSYIDKTAVNGAAYSYTVCAVTAGGVKASEYNKTGLTTVFLTRPAFSSVENTATGEMTVSWQKNTGCTGYQIQYTSNSKFASFKTINVSSKDTVSKAITGLVKGRTYYVRMRTYKKVGTKTYYTGWSKVRKLKIVN